MNWFMNFFTDKKVKYLEQENNELKEQLNECSEKLLEKQAHINKTNAYWKKKMGELLPGKSKKSRL